MISIIGIDSCSIPSFALFIVFQILCMLLCYFVKKSHIDFITPFSLLYKSYISGILAGILGIGGGLVINPVLLQMGYGPAESSALSAFVVLFTSASTSTQFLILGAFDYFNALFVAFLSIIGSIIGCFLLKYLIKKYKR